MTAPSASRASERGSVTLPYVYGIGLSLVLFTLVANLVVHQYGHGLIRAVADDAVRVGARTTASVDAAVAACHRTAAARRDGLIGERLTDEFEVHCAVRGDRLHVEASATFPGWLPMVPDWRPAVTASARWEGAR